MSWNRKETNIAHFLCIFCRKQPKRNGIRIKIPNYQRRRRISGIVAIFRSNETGTCIKKTELGISDWLEILDAW